MLDASIINTKPAQVPVYIKLYAIELFPLCGLFHTVNINTMLITVYKLTRPGLLKVNEYYKWKLAWPEDAKTRHKLSCPGCGKLLDYAASQGNHQCPGTLTDKPVTPSRNRRVYRTRENDAKLKEYVAKLPHKVQFSD